MNAPNLLQHPQVTADLEETSRVAALDRFAIEAFQNLPKKDLLLAQHIAGHGQSWGLWKTSKDICGSRVHRSVQTIDLEYRIVHFLDDPGFPPVGQKAFDCLLNEGLLVLTRLALLMRLAPTRGNGTARIARLKPSSTAAYIYNYWPKIIARAIRRKADQLDAPSLIACLTNDDVQEFSKDRSLRKELNRIEILAALGCWTDLPPHTDVGRPTDPSGSAPRPVPEKVQGEYQPIPDLYLEEFGPRNLWVIHSLGPCLLPLLENLATELEGLNWKGLTGKKLYTKIIPQFIAQHLKDHPWLDHMGKPLSPNFPLKTGSNNQDKFQFLPRSWEQLKILSSTLQSAHLFLTLLQQFSF